MSSFGLYLETQRYTYKADKNKLTKKRFDNDIHIIIEPMDIHMYCKG